MSFAFFDICSRHPDATNSRFVTPGAFDNCARSADPASVMFVRSDDIAALQQKIAAIYDIAEASDAPVLSTTCLKVQRTDPGLSVRATVDANPDGNTAFVAMDAAENEIAKALTRRRIVLERLSCATGAENNRLRTFDVFGINPHTAAVARHWLDRHWLVFGIGSETCMLAAVEGLGNLGARVTVIDDACIVTARNTPAHILRTETALAGCGAARARFEALFPDNAYFENQAENV